MVLLQGLCYVVDITMVFLTFIGIFDFVFHLVELSRGLLLLNLPYRTVPGIVVAVQCWFENRLRCYSIYNYLHLVDFTGIRVKSKYYLDTVTEFRKVQA